MVFLGTYMSTFTNHKGSGSSGATGDSSLHPTGHRSGTAPVSGLPSPARTK